MILLSGITDSAVVTVFALLFAASLVSYLITYFVLKQFDSIEELLKGLKMQRPMLFYLAHLMIYLLSCLLFIGGFAFVKYIFY